MRALLMLGLLGLALAAAGDDAVRRGQELFFDTQEFEYPSCAQCHNLVPASKEAKQERQIGPGATLFGSAVREGWRNMNTYPDVGEASQICAKRWQKRKGGLNAAQRRDLIAFLRTKVPVGTLPKRKVQRRPKLLKKLDGGDPKRGKRLTERHCTHCHNAGDDAVSFAFKPGRKKRSLLARAVRGYDDKRKFKPKTMSYFTNDRLKDGDLLDILAYLGR